VVNEKPANAPGNVKNGAAVRPWMRNTLALAGVYNLIWGTWVVAWPNAYFQLLQIELPRYPQIWQCVGMIVGVYGIAYLLAARSPTRHWPIVVVGLIGKVLGPLGFLAAAVQVDLPWSWGITLLFNDLAWWVPFVIILTATVREASDTTQQTERLTWDRAMTEVLSHRGQSLAQLSQEGHVMVVFLRHSGCAFCHETLDNLAEVREQIEARARIAIVVMSDSLNASLLTEQHELQDTHRFVDPTCQLYDAFALRRGSLSQVIGPRVWFRGLVAVLRGNRIGKIDGDVFRLPGVFLLRHQQIVSASRAEFSSDRPALLEILNKGIG